METLATEKIDTMLTDLPEWTRNGDSLQRTFGFDDFKESMSFVNRIGELAEQMQHHPDILIRFNKVTLTLTTHDAGGLTEKDFQLAGRADTLVEKESASS